MDTLTIRRVALSALHADPANARSHDDRNLAAIAASLKQFGQAEPLVVQRSTGKVIGGNGRMTAMKALGWTECDVVELDLDDTQATALGIALNRTGELAEWDLPALTKILESFKGQTPSTRSASTRGTSPADPSLRISAVLAWPRRHEPQ